MTSRTGGAVGGCDGAVQAIRVARTAGSVVDEKACLLLAARIGDAGAVSSQKISFVADRAGCRILAKRTVGDAPNASLGRVVQVKARFASSASRGRAPAVETVSGASHAVDSSLYHLALSSARIADRASLSGVGVQVVSSQTTRTIRDIHGTGGAVI